jgi:integrase
LNQAVFWQVIPSNIVSRVKPPKVARTEAKYLDKKQTAELLQLMENESFPHQTMIKMFLYSGLPRGEMCGL